MQLVFGYSFPLYLVILDLHAVEEFWQQIYKEHHIKCSMYCNSKELLYSPKLSARDQALKIIYLGVFFFPIDLTINKKVLNHFVMIGEKWHLLAFQEYLKVTSDGVYQTHW